MKNTELLRNHYVSLLSKKIVANGGPEVSTAEEIFDNLSRLANEQIQFGDERNYWLDISTKKMLAKIIDPDCRLEYQVMERTKTELAIEARLYWSECDKPAGIGFVKRSLTQLVFNDKDAAQIEIEFEALVRGAAATRALTDAGIGLEFYSDGFDTLFEELEGKEADDRADRKKETEQAQFDKAIPPIPTAEERKAAAIKGNASKKATDTTVTPAPVPEPATTLPSEETTSEVDMQNISSTSMDETMTETSAREDINGESEISSNASTLTIDEAKLVVADIGNFTGQPLGLIFTANPRNLVWLIKNNSAVSDAARVILEGDERFAKFI